MTPGQALVLERLQRELYNLYSALPSKQRQFISPELNEVLKAMQAFNTALAQQAYD